MASIAPVFAPDVQDIMRRRQMAQALMKQGVSTPTETQYAGGAAVKNSPLLGIGNLLAAALGAYKEKSANTDYQSAMANALKGVQGGQSAPSPQVSNVPQGTSSAPAYDPYSDPMNPTGAPAPKPQPQAQPQANPQPMPQTQAEPTLADIQRLMQFSEYKGLAEGLMQQYQAKQKMEQDRALAEFNSKLRTGEHATNLDYDRAHPEAVKPPSSVAEYNFAKGQGYKGSFAQYQKEQKTAVAQFHMDNPTPVNTGDPGDDAALAHGIATGQLPPLTGMASRSPRAGKIMAMVLKENPQYRGTDYGTSAAAEKFFTSGKGGQTLRSLDVAHAHLDTLSHLADALQNGNTPLVNKISNAVATQTGGTAPASFDAAKRIVSDEIAKAIVGGATALGDREEAARSISSAQTPAQLKQVIQTYQELMRGQIGGLADQYHNSTNRDDFYTRFSLKSTPNGGAPAGKKPSAGGAKFLGFE